MRDSLKKLLQKTISLKYTLPYKEFDKISITTLNDYCLDKSNEEDLVELIYNSIVDYCLKESEINIEKLDRNQKYALKNRMRFEEDDSLTIKKAYGFYGETLLNCIVMHLFNTKKIIAKGFFYNILENSESKGYDSFHFLNNDNNIELWFGEAKMYSSLSAAVDKVLSNLSKALSVNYLNRNFRAIIEKYNNVEETELTPKIEELSNKIKDEDINVWNTIKEYNVKIVYPIFISYQMKNSNYDHLIKQTIKTIEKSIEKCTFANEINAEILFILLPVTEMSKVKEGVIEWICQEKSVK